MKCDGVRDRFCLITMTVLCIRVSDVVLTSARYIVASSALQRRPALFSHETDRSLKITLLPSSPYRDLRMIGGRRHGGLCLCLACLYPFLCPAGEGQFDSQLDRLNNSAHLGPNLASMCTRLDCNEFYSIGAGGEYT
jgi:hypothetical protein